MEKPRRCGRPASVVSIKLGAGSSYLRAPSGEEQGQPEGHSSRVPAPLFEEPQSD